MFATYCTYCASMVSCGKNYSVKQHNRQKKLKQLVNQLLKFAAKKTHTKIWITTQKSYAIIKMEESTALVDLLTNNYTRLIQQTLSTTALTEQ